MNTIFKFYYQAWALFAVGSAYGLYTLFSDRELIRPAIPLRLIAGAGAAALIGAGLLYPVYGIPERTVYENNGVTTPTLDGWRSVVQQDDYNALMCLSQLVGNDNAVVLEATGGSYDNIGPGPINSGRTSALIGLPTVIGWQGHEGQWRGASYGQVVGARPDEVRRIYEDLRLDVVQPIIDKYGIDYIVYGAIERSSQKYGSSGEQKFLESYEVVCESGNSRVFKVGNKQIAQAG